MTPQLTSPLAMKLAIGCLCLEINKLKGEEPEALS